MARSMKFRRGCALGLVLFIGCLTLALPASGQLSLISSTPSDGDTDVDTLLTLVLEFSAPLDTTVRFEEPGDYFLGFQVFPADSVGEPGGDMTVSADSTTVTVSDIPLTADTKFVFVLTGAKNAAGDPLDRPYGFTFTTYSSLPEGSVSGTVSYPGGDPGGTAVGLFIEPPFGGGDDDEDDGGPDLEAGAVIPLSSDSYTVNFVPGGHYYVLGFKDINQDGEFEFPGDAFGGFDADGDSIADRIAIADGENFTDIDLTIGISPDVTARVTFPSAQDVAQVRYPDAELSVLVTSPISEDGTSQNWLYGFYSALEDTLFGVGRAGAAYFFFTLPMDGGDGPTVLPDIPLPENWIDSDMAADTAEAYVGSEFRDQYPDVQSMAFAATFFFTDEKILALAGAWPAGWPAMASLPDNADPGFFPATASVDTFTAWVFSYVSELAGEDRNILLDVETGSPIFPSPGQPTAARDNLDTADTTAAVWAADAVLVILGNIHTLTPEGLADAWGFGYYSALKDSILSLFIASDIVTDQETDSTHVVPSLEPLPQAWLDSPVVTPIADAASDDFRNQHPDAWVVTQLSRELRPSDPSLAVWRFMYWSDADTTGLNIYVDALTGDIVTGVEEPERSESLPRGFALEQNYPNPFNPGTTISYHLTQDGHVEMAVFNLLGQRVRVLADGFRQAGNYEVSWDGSDDFGHQVSSGIYLCRMKAGEFTQVKKMVLLR
jgi:hypothetical protein